MIATAEGILARGELSSSRLNAIVMTLKRSTEFSRANQPPAAGTRVEFAGSPVILAYDAGRGLQIRPLANFGKANAAWSTCKGKADRTCTKLRTHLDAMLAIASRRGTFTTWECYFDFEDLFIGLDDRDYTGDARGTTLFRAGHSRARWLVPQADTGSWSRYSLGGPESTREYHVLLRDILANLCKRIGTPEYCTTADRFTGYLALRPA